MNVFEFSKLKEGDIIHVPFAITNRKTDRLVEAESLVEIDDEKVKSLFDCREIRYADKKRRQFKKGDIVRVKLNDTLSTVTIVMQDEGQDGLVGIAYELGKQTFADYKDVSMILPCEVKDKLPEWLEGMHPEMLKGLHLSFESLEEVAYNEKGGQNG